MISHATHCVWQVAKNQSDLRELIVTVGTLRYWNADALKNALVEEGLDRVYGVRGGKIKLRMCCVRKRQREVSSCDGLIQRNSRSVALSHATGFITDVEFLLLYEENTSDNLMIR